MAAELRLPSFAKINWLLRIEGRRPDGYHQITTLFQTIDLSDRLTFEVTVDRDIALEVRGREVAAGPENLVCRAALAIRDEIGSSRGLRVVLEKHIPAGAGLGGGSSNAAVTLLAANHLWEGHLGVSRLAEIGSRLGADVPFFFLGGTAVGRGRGDELQTLPDCASRYTLVLLYPGFPIPTAEAYAARDWSVSTEGPVLTSPPLDNKIQHFCEAMTRGPDDVSWLENDFEQVIFERYPALGEGREQLMAAGCERVLLCGSGSTLMGIAPPGKGETIVQGVSQQIRGEIFLCHSLSREEYEDAFFQAGLKLTHQ